MVLFTLCQEDLYKRAIKAYFKISKYFVNVKTCIKTFLKLFDHTVKPIFLYACEIWGTININSCVVKKDDYILEHSFRNLYCDKLHMKSLKYILGVHKHSVNDAVLGETGRYPLYIDMLTQSTKYFSRLLNAKPTALISSAFQESLALHKASKTTWVSSMLFLFDKCKLSQGQHYDKNLSGMVKTKVVNEFKMNWSARLNKCENEQSGKLRTYAKFKKQFMYEPYLDYIKDSDVRVFLTKLRISSHKLEIEAGRYKNIPATDRLCKCCTLRQTETEKHFMFDCPLYECERSVYVTKIGKIVQLFPTLTKKEQFIYSMSSENIETIVLTGNFVYQCHLARFKFIEAKR